MAKTGTVTAISMENGMISIQDGQYTNEYSFTHPYTAGTGRPMPKGAATFMKAVPEVGNTVDYSYGDDNGLKFLKFLNVIPGGASQGNPTPYSAPAKTTPQYSNTITPDKTQMIYRQHAEKLITQFLSENPEHIDTKDGAISTEVAFLDAVTNLSDILVQRFCVTYGLTYINLKP